VGSLVSARGALALLAVSLPGISQCRCWSSMEGLGLEDLQALPGRRFRASLVFLMNEQMKGEGGDLGEFQQVGCPALYTSGHSQGWWKPSGTPEPSCGSPHLPPTSLVPTHHSSSSSAVLASQATFVTRGSWTCTCESFSWL